MLDVSFTDFCFSDQIPYLHFFVNFEPYIVLMGSYMKSRPATQLYKMRKLDNNLMKTKSDIIFEIISDEYS